MATAILVPGDDSKRLQAEQSASNMCDSSLPSPMKQTYVVSEDRLRELPVPETDDDWYEVERTLNTLDNVLTRYAEIHSCLVDPVMRMYIVEDFVHTCQSATLLPLWGRVTAFRDALHVVLRSVNEETGGKYKELEDSIFAKADEDSWPPMKTEHPDYDRDLGRWDVYGDLTWTMDDILTIAVGALHIRRERFG